MPHVNRAVFLFRHVNWIPAFIVHVYCKVVMSWMLHKMVIFRYAWYQQVVAIMIRCGIRFLLVSSRRFLTIVYGWSYTVVCILEERLFGVHAKKKSWGNVMPSSSDFRFAGKWTLTTSCDSEWDSRFSVLKCRWYCTLQLPWVPSLPPYWNICMKWSSESRLSLEIKKKKKLPHQYVGMYLPRLWSGTALVRKPEAVPDGFH